MMTIYYSQLHRLFLFQISRHKNISTSHLQLKIIRILSTTMAKYLHSLDPYSNTIPQSL